MATKEAGTWSKDFGIRQFYQQVLNAGGFARDMQLRVTNFTVNGINSLALTDLIFLRTAQLPGKKINTIELPYMGVDLQIPSTVLYDPNPLPVDFYCTQQYNIRKLLETSMRSTFNGIVSVGDIEPRDAEKNTITLALFDDNMDEVRSYKLYGAFINDIGAISYDATLAGQIQKVTANIAYQYWLSDEEYYLGYETETEIKVDKDGINTKTSLGKILNS